ncbi:MAG: Hsp20/alpha crystallin family protein [Chloroflexi bacterium]|nr:Hsp20/alpha crystallin family protein [Chloroflexota bacterium]
MTQRASDVFSEFERIRERMQQAWSQVIGPPGAPRFCAPIIEPAVDVYETDDEVVVVVEIAGIADEEVQVEVEGKALVLSGERRSLGGRPRRLYSQMEVCHGPFQREILLPAEVNPERARATYNAGMLEIVMPKVGRKLSRQVRIVAR